MAPGRSRLHQSECRMRTARLEINFVFVSRAPQGSTRHPALNRRSYEHVYTTEAVLIFDRCQENARLRVALNLSGESQPVKFPAGDLVLSSYLDMPAGRA